jgi:cytochrome c oxidase cbb3-type subunit I/II
MSDRKITINYNDRIVRQFMWGVVGMLVGVLIASQLNFHQLNFGLPG